MAATATDAPPTSTSEMVISGVGLPLTEPARAKFNLRQVELIHQSKAKGADQATLYTYLELAARYDLDPFANEIWCANMRGTLAIFAGIAGYLKNARRDPDYISIPGQAVYERDHFTAEYISDEVGWRVEHKITNPADRGRSLGAWALLLRRGKPADFFFAKLEQFRKASGAWPYEDPMIVKCARSYLLRTTYGISGPVPADEVAVGFDASTGSPLPAVPLADTLPPQLHELVVRAGNIDPKAWRANEIAARLPVEADPSYEGAVAGVCAEIESWLAEHEISDAVVVEDEPARPGRWAGAAAAMKAKVEQADAIGVPEAAFAALDDDLDPFTAEMMKADAKAAADAADGVETTDVPADLDARWRSTADADVAWRESVDPILRRRADLEAAADDVSDDQRDMVDEELRGLDADLDALGVPAGWFPSADEQGQLDV